MTDIRFLPFSTPAGGGGGVGWRGGGRDQKKQGTLRPLLSEQTPKVSRSCCAAAGRDKDTLGRLAGVTSARPGGCRAASQGGGVGGGWRGRTDDEEILRKPLLFSDAFDEL